MPDETADHYVVLRRSDAEALNEEHAIFDDPFWRPLDLIGASVEIWESTPEDGAPEDGRVIAVTTLNAYDPEHAVLNFVVTLDA